MSDFALTKTTSKKNIKKRRKRSWIKRVLLGFMLVIIAVIGASIVFEEQIGAKIRTTLDSSLTKQGIYVDYGIRNFSVLSGLALEDVVIFETSKRDEKLLTLSNVSVGYNLITLVREFSAATVLVKLDDSALSLYEGGEARDITGLDARLALSRTKLGINRLMADFRDVKVDITGDVGFAESEKSEKEKDEKLDKPDRAEGETSIDLSPVIAFLDKLPDSEDGEILIRGEINSDQKGLEWEADISGDVVNYAALKLQNVSISAASPNPDLIEFSTAKFDFAGRSFDAAGSYQIVDQQLELTSLDSGVDVKALLNAIDPKLGEKVPELPQYQASASGSLYFKDVMKSRVAGALAIEEVMEIPMGEKQLILRTAATDFVLETGILQVSDFDATLGSGAAPVRAQGQFELKLPEGEGDSISMIGIDQIVISQGAGNLEFVGTIDLVEKLIQIASFKSDIDPFAVMASIGISAPESPVTFANPPAITASGSLPLEAPANGDLSGSLKLAGTTTVAMPDGKPPVLLQNATTDFAINEGLLNVSDFKATLGKESAPVNVVARLEMSLPKEKGDTLSVITLHDILVSHGAGKLEVSGALNLSEKWVDVTKLESNLDPFSVISSIGLNAPESPVTFANPPVISVAGRLPFETPAEGDLSGSFSVAGTTTIATDPEKPPFLMQDASTNFAIREGTLQVDNLKATLGATTAPVNVVARADMPLPKEKGEALGVMELHDVVVTQGDRRLTLAGGLELTDKAINISSVTSNLEPFAVMRSLGLSAGAAPVTFTDGPSVEASGRIPFAAPLTGGLTGSVKVAGDITVPIPDKAPLVFQNLSSGFTLTEGNVVLSGLSTKTLGGELRYDGAITPADAVRFDGSLVVDSVRLEQIMALAGQSEDRVGKVDLTFNGSGSTSLESLEGGGALSVTEAEFVSVPIYGGLRPLLMAINLGGWNGDSNGTSLTANYAMSAGSLTSENIILRGEFYEIGSTLELDFQQNEVDATGAIATTGNTKVITGLVGKLLEVEASGPFDDIGWRLKNAAGITNVASLAGKSTEFLADTLLGASVTKSAINLPGNVLKTIAPGMDNSVIEAPAAAVEAVGDVVGKLLPFGGKKKDEKEREPTRTEPASPAPFNGPPDPR